MTRTIDQLRAYTVEPRKRVQTTEELLGSGVLEIMESIADRHWGGADLGIEWAIGLHGEGLDIRIVPPMAPPYASEYVRLRYGVVGKGQLEIAGSEIAFTGQIPEDPEIMVRQISTAFESAFANPKADLYRHKQSSVLSDS